MGGGSVRRPSLQSICTVRRRSVWGPAAVAARCIRIRWTGRQHDRISRCRITGPGVLSEREHSARLASRRFVGDIPCTCHSSQRPAALDERGRPARKAEWFSPHGLRRACSTDKYERGGDLGAIQLLGHWTAVGHGSRTHTYQRAIVDTDLLPAAAVANPPWN